MNESKKESNEKKGFSHSINFSRILIKILSNLVSQSKTNLLIREDLCFYRGSYKSSVSCYSQHKKFTLDFFCSKIKRYIFVILVYFSLPSNRFY